MELWCCLEVTVTGDVYHLKMLITTKPRGAYTWSYNFLHFCYLERDLFQCRQFTQKTVFKLISTEMPALKKYSGNWRSPFSSWAVFITFKQSLLYGFRQEQTLWRDEARWERAMHATCFLGWTIRTVITHVLCFLTLHTTMRKIRLLLETQAHLIVDPRWSELQYQPFDFSSHSLFSLHPRDLGKPTSGSSWYRLTI
jgi:hypothetical protein